MEVTGTPTALAVPRPRSVLLSSARPGPRSRRPAEVRLLTAAVAAAAFVSLWARGGAAADPIVAAGGRDLLGWADGFWRAGYLVAVLYGVVLFVEPTLRRRWAMLRDLVLAGSAALTAALSLATVADGYPSRRLALATSLLMVAAPELARPARRVGGWLLAWGAVGGIILGVAETSAVLGGFAVGIAVGAAVRCAFGSSAGFPDLPRVLAGLDELGIRVADLAPAARQRPGAAIYQGREPAGRDLVVTVLGRDAQDTQRLANTWRRLAYRDTGPRLAPGRVQLVEHEALTTLLAERAGVHAPSLVAAGLVGSGDAMLVLARPASPVLEEQPADSVTAEFLTALWEEAARLRAHRIAHRRLNAQNVLVTPDGPMIVGFAAARPAASDRDLDIDLAELLIATTVLLGPDRALSAALDRMGHQAVASTLPYLQRAALTPHLRDLAHGSELRLKDLRTAAAVATGVDAPQIAPLRRVRPRDLVIIALAGISMYLLISQLADIGFTTVAHELRGATWQWAAIALVVAQLTLVTASVAQAGSLAMPLPIGPTLAAESASKFISLAMPSGAGWFAFHIRYLQRLGAPLGNVVAATTVNDLTGTLVKILILSLVLPFVHPSTSLHISADTVLPALLTILVAIALLVLLITTVPPLREKVMPTARTAAGHLARLAKRPRDLLALVGGNAGSEVLYALALGAAAQAYGVHLSLAELLFVNIGVTLLAGLVPVPGGVGAAEAGLTAFLTTVGVPAPVAFPIALTHRLCTSYLPPLWGYASLRWLTHHGYV